MNQLRMVDVQDVLAQGGDALSKASGDMLKLVDAEVLSEDGRRNFIARAVARYADGRARWVIVKATRSSAYDPGAANVLQASGLAKEWVACAFLPVALRIVVMVLPCWLVTLPTASWFSRTLARTSARLSIRF